MIESFDFFENCFISQTFGSFTTVVLGYFLYRLLLILRLCWSYWFPSRVDYVKFADGGFAMITGGAGGIGKASAYEFAKMGIDLFLVDVNQKLLSQAKAELQRAYPNIRVKTTVVDLTKLSDEKFYDDFCSKVDEVKIGILFNNAGMSEKVDSSSDMKFVKFEEKTHDELVLINKLNVIAPTLIYKAVLPQMLKRGNGLMLAMCSAAGLCPTSLMPLYGSTKSYLLQLSSSLQVKT